MLPDLLSALRSAPLILLAALSPVSAAPDEDKLGKQQGYPVGKGGDWFTNESVRVGSLTHQAEIRGLFGGRVNVLPAAARPMPLPVAAREPDYRWDTRTARGLTVDDFLGRQRIMGLLIVKDGVVQVERYQYDRKPTDRFTSQSIAKSITALAVGLALDEGRIRSLDDRADRYAVRLKDTVYGRTTIRNLLRMASGARYQQSYDGTGDTPRFGAALVRDGIEAATRMVSARDTPQGERFYYASPHTVVLAAVLRGAVGTSLSEYLGPRLWQAIGAEQSALWRTDKTGLEVAFGNFNATLRDYARLGIVLAADGVRPDDPRTRQIIPRDFLLDATDWKRAPAQFQPGKADPFLGYGYQFWLYPGQQRRFIMLGVHGQSIFIDPGQRLVVVQTAANATALAGETTLGSDRLAFWRGVLRYHERQPLSGAQPLKP